VADGTINTASSMTLVGKNYAGYGEFLDENFIHLLENSANTSAPGSPLTGQLWWDSTNALMKVVLQAKDTPQVIMSDNESAFKSDTFQDFLFKHKIALDMNVVNDHNALGIIDNMAKRLKKSLKFLH
jgi:hypothetical protein